MIRVFLLCLAMSGVYKLKMPLGCKHHVSLSQGFSVYGAGQEPIPFEGEVPHRPFKLKSYSKQICRYPAIGTYTNPVLDNPT